MKATTRILAVLLALVLCFGMTATTAFADDPVSIRWIIAGDETEASAAAVEAANELLKERYNLKLDAVFVSMGNYNDKMTMMINAGDDWDVSFSSGGWLNVYSKAVALGAFLDLTPYIEADPELTAHIPDFMMESIKYSDGQIYAIPNYQISVDLGGGLCFQQSILDEMKADGIDFDPLAVKIGNDMIPFLDYVKEKHPELYPANWSVPGYGITATRRSYGWYDVAGYTAIPDGDGWKLVWLADEYTKEEQMEMKVGDWYSQMLMRDWWEKGYLRADIPTTINDNAELNSNLYAVFGETGKPGLAGEKLRNCGIPYFCVLGTDTFYGGGAINAMNAINAMSEHPDEAVKMVKAINTDTEIFNLLIFGVEGQHYHLNDENKVVVDAATGIQAWVIGNQCNALLSEGQDDDTWIQTDELNRSATVSPFIGFSVNNENVTEAKAALSAKQTEYDKWQYEDNYEELYDEMIAELAPFHEMILAEYQAQLDAWWAENGK